MIGWGSQSGFRKVLKIKIIIDWQRMTEWQ